MTYRDPCASGTLLRVTLVSRVQVTPDKEIFDFLPR